MEQMIKLTEHHRKSCQAYDDICHGTENGPGEWAEAGPYIPVALFKDLMLRSVPEEDVVRQVTSSGTTGQRVSRIFLDAETADLQRWALASITGDFIGGKRMPMLIIDSPDVLRDRRKFSARGAGILGFSMMSSKRFYALDEEMRIDWPSVEAFCEAAKAGPSFAFGFTFMIWQYFYEALVKEGRKLDLAGCYLIHGGGWKKLQEKSVSDERFRECLRERCGFGEISDYYGMAEQTGSIFMQCPCGHLHASVFSDIEVLDHLDFSPCDTGTQGLIALRSWIPTSYPGHMLLTEDQGRILGEDDCPCGRKGKYFSVSGRIKKAEIRGCSDTFEGAGAAPSGAGRQTASAAVSGTAREAGLREEDLQVLAGQWPAERLVRKPFDPLVLSFLEELSRMFMKDPAFRKYPDIYALGFWLRPAHLSQLQQRQERIWADEDIPGSEGSSRKTGTAANQGAGGDAGPVRQGRGMVLHIAPSNMPAMFAYSWVTALLAGCGSALRLSGKESDITETILLGIRQLLDRPEYGQLRRSNVFLRFPRGHKALEEISGAAGARMIWGGDETVRQICSIPKKEQAIDIPFPDKYSLALLDTHGIAGMTEDELRMQAHLFCRDTYGADQNACSSPRSVFWMKNERDETSAESLQETKQRWWDAVASEAERYTLEPWMATEKYRLLCLAYAEERRLMPVKTWTNRLYVIPCGSTADWIAGAPNSAAGSADAGSGAPNSTAGSEDTGSGAPEAPALPEGKLGMFFEFDLEDLQELFPLLGPKIQTVVCAGTDPAEFLHAVRAAGCPGVDRAVHPGEALEFDTIWDRKDLIGILTERG